jgi:hypothetical protein
MTYHVNYLLLLSFKNAERNMNKQTSKRTGIKKRANGLYKNKIREDKGRTTGYTDIANTSTY